MSENTTSYRVVVPHVQPKEQRTFATHEEAYDWLFGELESEISHELDQINDLVTEDAADTVDDLLDTIRPRIERLRWLRHTAQGVSEASPDQPDFSPFFEVSHEEGDEWGIAEPHPHQRSHDTAGERA